MQSFDPKAATEALLTELAGAGDGEDMAMSVRKAGWLATQMKPIELINISLIKVMSLIDYVLKRFKLT